MTKGRTHLTGCWAWRKECRPLPGMLLEGLCVNRFAEWLPESMPRHVKLAKAEQTTCGIADEEVLGSLHPLYEVFRERFPCLIVAGEGQEPRPFI